MRRRAEDISEDAGPESGELFVLEREQRLSDSLLWSLQRAFFDREGIDAWRDAAVPHYITNNPALASAYAEVVLGFLRDCRGELDPSEPITILELGAGSGRFAYLFLKAFTDLHRRSPLADVPFRYVMTDFTERNLDFFRSRDALRPFVDRGVLDFARFDVEREGEITLENAGVKLSPGALRNPLIAIANYVFDSVRQDAFHFAGGKLEECLVSLTSPEPAVDLAAPDLLGRLGVSWSRRPAPIEYHGEPALDDLLRAYARTLDGVTVLFPTAALRCVVRLAALSGGKMLLISGDRGQIHEDAVGEPEGLGMAIHGGAFSLPVNYHAIAEHVQRGGGRVLTTAHRHAHLNVSAFVLGEHPAEWIETRLAYGLRVERLGPDDLYSVSRCLRSRHEALDLGDLLSLIRVSCWDPRVLGDCLPALWRHVTGVESAMRDELLKTVARVWENYYPIGEELDLAFELGLLLHALEADAAALGMFQESERLYGEDPRARWNAGLCHYGLGRPDEAARCFGEALRLDPGFRPQGALQIKAELG